MELRSFLQILWRRKWVILVTAVVTLAIAVAGTLMMPPTYEAHATVRLVMEATGSLGYVDYRYAERLLNTYTDLATSRPVLDALEKQLGLPLPEEIEVVIIPNTELMDIAVQDSGPVLARNAANLLAEILVSEGQELYASGTKTAHEILSEQLAQIQEELDQARDEYDDLVLLFPDDSQRIEALRRSIELKQETYATLLGQYESARATEAIRANALTIVELATIPQSPSSPNTVLNIALGCIVGLIGGLGLGFLFEHLDTRLYTVTQIEAATELPALGRIRKERKALNNPILAQNSPQWEAFRRLWTSLCAATRGKERHTLLVTSAEPGEGKSTVVTNLAATIAQGGQSVLVVDADLRRPTQHINFDLSNDSGLSTLLEDRCTLQDAIQGTAISGISVLTSGPLEGEPASTLCSDQMTTLLQEMKRHFDQVLLDAPGFLPVTDTAILAPLVDGVLLVVACGQTTSEAVRYTCRELDRIGARTFGLVVTRVSESSMRAYDKYYRRPGAGLQGDALTRIHGIGPGSEKALHTMGIVSFAQLAAQDPETLAANVGRPITANRIRRERWVEQARALVGRMRAEGGAENGSSAVAKQGADHRQP